ncbi:hypothetical protein OI76_07100 [Listeria monocytogenes]|nr:hypothetical protein OI76_07100 [Listeria monocytogenes]KID22912.1 hypothetical protein RM65_13020 [Listeria monocytogenes]
MDEEKLNKEMMNVVNSDEAKQVFEKRLTSLDAKAFTEEGKIHSYEIDKNSIGRNPMGGINITLFISKDTKLVMTVTVVNFDGKLNGGVANLTEKLSKLLGRWRKNK